MGGASVIDPAEGVLGNLFFEKIGFTVEGDLVHPLVRVGGVVSSWISRRHEQMIRNILDVIGHGTRVHA